MHFVRFNGSQRMYNTLRVLHSLYDCLFKLLLFFVLSVKITSNGLFIFARDFSCLRGCQSLMFYILIFKVNILIQKKAFTNCESFCYSSCYTVSASASLAVRRRFTNSLLLFINSAMVRALAL